MVLSALRLIKRCALREAQDQINLVPLHTRGIYVLFQHRPESNAFDVVYVGLAGGPKAGIRSRLRSHSRRKKGEWSHFSVFEVWDNIQPSEVAELESLFREIYSRDSRANRLNVQKGSRKLKRVAKPLASWGARRQTSA